MTDTLAGTGVAAVTAFAAEVAGEIERRWDPAGDPGQDFPQIAHAALTGGLGRHPFRPPDLVDWTVESVELPHQARLDETFGQPPLTLFWNGAFQIDALFWVHSSTAVHGHGFDGAFCVIDGHCLHTLHAFRESGQVDGGFRLGAVDVIDTELLAPAAVRAIAPGAELIHSVVHLDLPTVTVVARTCSRALPDPELVYFPPGLALDPSRSDALRTRRIQLVRMLLRTAAPSVTDVVERLVGTCDAHTAFLVALELGVERAGADVLLHVLSLCARRWGEATAEMFAEAVVIEVRRRAAAVLLRHEDDTGCRAVLGALVALDDPQQIADLLRRAVPGEPLALVRECGRRVNARHPGRDAGLYRHPALAPLRRLDPTGGLP